MCIFLGYSAQHKGYRYLDLTSNRVITSRHVIFDEDAFPFAERDGPQHYKKSCDPWRLIFITDHWKIIIKPYLWWSQISSCIEHYKLHLMMFLIKIITDYSIHDVLGTHKIALGPFNPASPIIYDENKHHGFNCHITQHPCGRWHGCLVALMWQILWH